jgi:hypothetical protein
MKKIFVLLSVLMLISLVSCGPSQKEQEKQKKIDDSLFEKDRNTALDNANKLLSDTTAVKDTLAKKSETKKKH